KLRRGWGVGVPEFGLFVVGVEKDGVVAVLVGEAAEGVVAGSVVAGAAGECGGGVLFVGAFGAAVDVEPDHRIAGVYHLLDLLREVERGEVVGAGGVVELPEDRGDLVIGGVGGGDESDGVV